VLLRVLAAVLVGAALSLRRKSMKGTITPLDLRDEGRAKLKSREESSGKRFSRDAPRDVTQIDSVVLHQMGFSRGSDPTRYLGVPAHYIVLPDGVVAQLHDWETYLFTSNSLNSRSLGVEIAGNFPNENGTWWRPEDFGMDRPTPEQLDAVRRLLRYIAADLAEQGSRLRGVYAHRQSSPQKRNDPGPDVWRAVSSVFDELELDDVSGFSTGGGRPIPESWKTNQGGAVS